MSAEHALGDLALVFGVLFVASLLALVLSGSVVPFYMLAGVALQALIRNPTEIEIFALLGVSLLLFVIGLEFSVAALLADARALVGAGLWDLGINFGVGLVVGLGLGFSLLAATVFAGAFYVSSSVIVASTIVRHRLSANAESGPALGIIVFEDLFIALFLAGIAAAVSVGSFSVAPVAMALVKTVGFLGGVFLVSRALHAPLERLLGFLDDERLVIFVFFWVLAFAALAELVGVSAAVGAFLAGVVVAGTAMKRRVERLVLPYQQLFAALFFIAFGLMIDPRALTSEWVVGLAVAVLALASKMITGWAVGWRRSFRPATRLRLGLLLAPRGEFSIVLAGLALAADVPGADRLGAIVTLYVLGLSVAGPLILTRAETAIDRLARLLERPV